MVWFAFALMTAAAVLCVSWPLMRTRHPDAAGASDVAFYRQQLGEIDGDVERGLLDPADAATARAELGRRLLGAVDRAGAAAGPGRRRVAAGALAGAFVVAVTVTLYARVGHPRIPDDPLAARQTQKDDFGLAMARMEARLASNPDDGHGQELIAPIYVKLGRFEDAARAYRAAIRVLGATPDRQAELGQALVLAADGVVTGEARQAFDAALAQDPALPQARFFEGLAAVQDGDKSKARALWTALIDAAPAGAPYTGILRQRIAELDGPPSPATPRAAPVVMPPGAGAIAALPPDEQRAAIHGMVDGLAARLAENGHDGDGWLKLVRAYRVLGEPDRARQALADARRSMGGDPQVLGRLDALAQELGLGG